MKINGSGFVPWPKQILCKTKMCYLDSRLTVKEQIMNARLVLTSMLLLTLGAVPMTTMAQKSNEIPAYRIVGYYPGWAIYDQQYFVTDIPADMLTHLNYAFATISDAGEVRLFDEWGDTQFPYPGEEGSTGLLGNFHQLQLLKQAHPHLQTLISIGGWTESGRFSDVALTPESRGRFARSAVEFMLRYGFDGIDIDWEYPTGGGLTGNIERPEDAENFVLLLQELRTQLDAQGSQNGRHYLLTIALGSGRDAYAPLAWARIHPLLDWINVMTYDMSGTWSSVTGFNAPLYDSMPNPPEVSSTATTLNDLLALGVPADKLVMGVPFYGSAWQGVSAANNGLHQPFTAPAGDGGSFAYRDLAANYLNNSDYQAFWDESAQAPWLYSANAGVMIAYDDPRSIALKANFVREHGLGGMMFWELSQDTADATLLTTIYNALNAG
jgi:chitinase